MAPPILLDSHPFELLPGGKPSSLVIERWRYENGLTLLLGEDHTSPVFAYQTWFDVGSSNEKVGRTGIAHLFEHLMFKRTSTHADGEFDRLIESRGGSSNAATWVDWTYYTSGLPARGDNLELVASYEADRITHLVLDVPQVEAEREVVLNERRYRVDNVPEGLMGERLYSLAFASHPYRWPTIGWEADIRAISTDDCVAFYRTWYSPNNATLVIVGDIDPAAVREIVGRHYGGLKAQQLPAESFPTEASPGPRREEMALTVESEKLLIAWRAPGLSSPDRPALSVLEGIAFHGNSSRVRHRLIEELQLAVEVGSMATPFKYPGLFEAKVDLAEGHVAEEAERELATLLGRLALEEVSAAELTKAKNQIELGFYAGLRTAGEKAEALGHMQVTAGDYRRLFSEMPKVQAVTAADVKRVAAALFREENRVVVAARSAGGPGEADP